MTDTVKKKATRKKAVPKPTQASTPALKKYYNGSSLNIFTNNGRIRPTDTVMMTSEEANDYEGLYLV